ncbi:MAG: germination protein YpeB [Oscillospiraceae bacterium]|nr:germination protein YpeB [Oscillospiraceae bacterium]
MHRFIKMTKRGFIRIVSFLLVAAAAFAVMSYVNHLRIVQAKRHIEYSYLRSLEHLSLSIEKIKNSINKGIYSNSPHTLYDLSGKMASDASTAKMSLSQLPVTELNLEKTNRFLSQVGNYSSSLARRFAVGEELTETDRDNLSKLLQHAESLADELYGIENMVAGGHLTFEEVVRNANLVGGSEQSYPGHISGGFENMENLFEEYPSLVYDGPFSDHIINQEPLLIKGQEAISKEKSLETARMVSGSDALEYASDQAGRIPSYTYADGDTTVSITQDGGFFVYMLKYRKIGEKAISTEKAVQIAEEYLTKIGYKDMVQTYYELNGGVCTVNFAGFHEDVTVYTDLIKVEVALDDGEIVAFDARGFITAHHQRSPGEPVISKEVAAGRLSESLTVQNVKLAIIPSMGEYERLCYEFLCTSKNSGNQVLVYINAETGYEEKIMLLRVGDNGTVVV